MTGNLKLKLLFHFLAFLIDFEVVFWFILNFGFFPLEFLSNFRIFNYFLLFLTIGFKANLSNFIFHFLKR